MATDLRSPPMRASPSASFPPASRRYQQPASDWPAHSPTEGRGRSPPLVLPFSLLLFHQPPSPSLVATVPHPTWIEKRPFSKAPQRILTSTVPVSGGCGQERLQKLSPLLHLHMMSCIGSAFVFSNHTHGAWNSGQILGPGWGEGGWSSWAFRP